MTVYFGVKYYAPDPCKLAEEITRYQFFLQCKQDILQGRLPIPFDLAIELFALAVQSELGDYDPQRHQDGYVGEFQFLPAQQSAELERRVALFHRQLTGQVPASAELNFLERVKWLDLYGCDLHPIQYDDESGSAAAGGSYAPAGQEDYALGLNPSGVSVLRNKLKVAHYVWQRIVKTKCQGRCFLMDVIGNLAMETANNRSCSSSAHQPQPEQQRQRFGFRLADKQASRQLRLSLEQHKSFYHLINQSATLSRNYQQQQKLSQRFRHSIRSAIQLGASSSGLQQHRLSQMQHQFAQQHHHQQQRQQQQQQRLQLRSSMKQHQYDNGDGSRQAPTVVRMPSRRYSKELQQQYLPAAANGLPSKPVGGGMQHAHTMLDHQRQQALMLMSQLNQQQQQQQQQQLGGGGGGQPMSMATKSQTLKPIASAKQAAATREKNQYYHQMMMAMMVNQQQQQLGPARHSLHQQPAASIYKSSSVINGINQLGSQNNKESMMQQLFNTRPQYPAGARGHESPRSTKSAIAPSSALKLASKKLAKQQQQLLYGAGGGGADAQPLLAYDPVQPQQMYSNYYGVSTAYNLQNASPRSARSARLISRHKSKSTNENLHLLHTANSINPSNTGDNKMLLATATQLMQQQQQQQQQQMQQMRPPPPNYSGNIRHSDPKYSDNCESELSKRHLSLAKGSRNRRAATFALTNEQANILFSAAAQSGEAQPISGSGAKATKKRAPILVPPVAPDDEDDYCCSRSDCSSAADDERRQPAARRLQAGKAATITSDHQDWNSIRRRHENFSRGKAAFQLMAHEQPTGEADSNNNQQQPGAAQLVKNIANKQATPILLSMNFEQQQQSGVNNSKAVQLLNLQRRQLNSSSSTASGQSTGSSSTESVKVSPQLSAEQQQSSASSKSKAADSTTSNSTTTSGYYAGSNSTGSASADSDSQQSSSRSLRPAAAQLAAGSRAKIALGSYSLQSRMSGDRLLIGNQAHLRQPQSQPLAKGCQQQKQQFYLGDPTNNNNSENKPIVGGAASDQENWQQQQQQPSSLKYVSFDV